MRLIDADELKEGLRDHFKDVMGNFVFNTTFAQLEAIIDTAQTVKIKPLLSVTFDKDELEQIIKDGVIEPIKNGELVVKKERPQDEDPDNEEVIKELWNCRNELCLRCGKYEKAYCGACDDCRYNSENMKRWRKDQKENEDG